jgi:hypothetical protein
MKAASWAGSMAATMVYKKAVPTADLLASKSAACSAASRAVQTAVLRADLLADYSVGMWAGW